MFSDAGQDNKTRRQEHKKTRRYAMEDNDNGMTPQWRSPGRPSRLGGLSRRAAVGVTALGLTAGGMAGGFIVSQAATSSSSSTSSNSSGTGTTTPSTTPTTPSSGPFHPNEDPTHEAGESAQREAQENAGQVPTVP